MSYKICGLESFDQADAAIIPDRSRRQAQLVTGNSRADLVILSYAKDLLLLFCLSFPKGICF